MLRRVLLLSFACAASLAPAAPIPPEDERTKLARLYGVWESPDRGSRFALAGGELRVWLPAQDTVLGPTRTGVTNNAPRALREVEGDFVATVRVVVPAVEGEPKGTAPYRSGGLVAWASATDYVVVRRCSGDVDGYRESVWCDQRHVNGSSFWAQGLRKTDGATFLRLTRAGDTITAGCSRDGKAWKNSTVAEEVAWGATVKVGVVAENRLGTATEITFDQYTLTRGKK